VLRLDPLKNEVSGASAIEVKLHGLDEMTSPMVKAAVQDCRSQTARTWRCSSKRSANCYRFSAWIFSFRLLGPQRLQGRFWYARSRVTRLKGYRTPNGFLVLMGSEAVALERASSEKWPWPRNMRQTLKSEGALSEAGDRLMFTRNVEFASPSAAAAVVHGGHANGLTAWKTSEGKTLKELESV
jgi:Domain of unknown function (DUF4357)